MIPDDENSLLFTSNERGSDDDINPTGGHDDDDDDDSNSRIPCHDGSKVTTSFLPTRHRPPTCHPSVLKRSKGRRWNLRNSTRRLLRKQLQGSKTELSRDQRSKVEPRESRDARIKADDAVVPRWNEENVSDDKRFSLTMTSATSGSDIIDDRRLQRSPTTAASAPNGATSPPPQQPQLVHPAAAAAETRLSTGAVDRHRIPSHRLCDIPLPMDPRQWSRLDVRVYLDHARHIYNIPDLDLDRFPMNGKGLCVLSKEMFQFRVPSGGISLYLDFQRRFLRALELR